MASGRENSLNENTELVQLGREQEKLEKQNGGSGIFTIFFVHS